MPFAIILGADEVAAGLVTVKEQRWEVVEGKKIKIESADKGTQVKRTELIEWLQGTDVWKAWEKN